MLHVEGLCLLVGAVGGHKVSPVLETQLSLLSHVDIDVLGEAAAVLVGVFNSVEALQDIIKVPLVIVFAPYFLRRVVL